MDRDDDKCLMCEVEFVKPTGIDELLTIPAREVAVYGDRLRFGGLRGGPGGGTMVPMANVKRVVLTVVPMEELRRTGL